MNSNPKICFYLQRNYAYTGHLLALWLQEKYGLKNFCAYVGLRRIYTFLSTQKEINYGDMVLDEDVYARYHNEALDLPYLKKLEKEFGIPNLWPYLTVERTIMFNQAAREYPYNTPVLSHEEMLRILQVAAKAVIAFLDKEKPDAIVFSSIGAVSSLLMYHIAKKRGIKILHILTTPLKDRFAVSETFDTFTGADALFKHPASGEARKEYVEEAKKIIEDFRLSPHPYNEYSSPKRQQVSRTKQFRFLLPARALHSISCFVELVVEYSKHRGDYTVLSPWNFLKDRTKRKLRNLYGVSDLYDTFDPRLPYAFFALHFEPEQSLLLLAPFAQDQIHLIKQAAKSLPVGYSLYVKEHPEMVAYRPRSYYKELRKIPNVKLISPAIEGLTVIAGAKLIFTVTGSAGWEGLLLKKPVIVFGNQFYNNLSMVKKCRDLETLPYLVKEQLEGFHYDEKELISFTAAILEDSASLPFIHIWEHETDEVKKKQGLEPLADLIAKKSGLAQDKQL